MKKIYSILTALLLSGCASVVPPYSPDVGTPSKQPQVLPRGYNPLLGIAGPDGPPITVAVYGFTDKTGQRKENDKFSIVGAVMGETVLDQAGVGALATLPSLDEVRASLIGLINAPATKVAGVLQAPAGQLARVFNAYATKDAA